MDDVTDTVFRRIVSDCAEPDYTMTEFVNVDGLCSVGRPKLMHRLSVAHDSVPVIAQIWGKNPENFKTVADEIASGKISGFSGIDLNFGCPEKSVVKNECCSAMQQPELRGKAIAIINATKEGIKQGLDRKSTALGPSSSKHEEGVIMPLSIKTRLGFDKIDYSWHEFLLEQKPAMLTVHVRTTRQMSKVPAQWEAIVPIVELRDKISPETKIVLNGDIMNHPQGVELAEKYGVDGIMIGRGIFHDPYAFAVQSPWEQMPKEERIALLIKHIELHAENYPNGERPFNPLKKFAKVYIQSFAGASELRDKIMHTNSVEEALSIL